MSKSVYRSKRSRNKKHHSSSDSASMTKTETVLNSFVKNWINNNSNSIDLEQIISKLMNSSEGNDLLKNSTSILNEYRDSFDTNNGFDFGQILKTIQSNENSDKLEDILNDSDIKDQAINMVNNILQQTNEEEENDDEDN
ncbi:hypothetical protein [Oceanobacillus halophilus]|uniref:Uncharacterized protein n=1 Tax=Oceanobacillus halophilus TaxID=930130 RepID=A0A495A367_9BACI|nr:hypothetical protein [Oceanobacillus halophilus]RKQ33955.1 hypothetical protein D8M06_09035 [Oceanobacillus halophilus]